MLFCQHAQAVFESD